jgi:hypothetical protein
MHETVHSSVNAWCCFNTPKVLLLSIPRARDVSTYCWAQLSHTKLCLCVQLFAVLMS